MLWPSSADRFPKTLEIHRVPGPYVFIGMKKALQPYAFLCFLKILILTYMFFIGLKAMRGKKTKGIVTAKAMALGGTSGGGGRWTGSGHGLSVNIATKACFTFSFL